MSGDHIFFDIEASSLGPDSYPIEVGWVSVKPNDEIVSGAMLIKPAADWTDWSQEAEAVHGISRTRCASPADLQPTWLEP